MTRGAEQADAVIVGARCAGSAAAIALARAGRRVVALDRARFPSDTLSTHVLFPSGVAELKRVGVLDEVMALGAPRCRWVLLSAGGRHVTQRFTPVDGIDFGICQPRPGLDLVLVERARAAGAEVREGVAVDEVIRENGRVAGVRWHDREGNDGETRAALTIGADGRRSTVARLVGADRPYRGSRNGRGLAFWYMDDPKAGTRWQETLVQWRVGETHGMAFPCPDDRILILFMGPAEEIPAFRADPEGMWRRMLNENRRLADRVQGAGNPTKLRSTGDTAAYFRASSGPGWALAGDAGHFKDPVIAQGIRDAVRFSRLLGEAVGPVLGEPAALDRALREWEARRDRECLPSYHWGNRETRIIRPSPLLLEALQDFSRTEKPEVTDAFNRTRRPEQVLGPRRQARALVRALRRPGADRGAILREAAGEARIEIDMRREALARAFRPSRPAASELPGWEWPPASPRTPGGRKGETPGGKTRGPGAASSGETAPTGATANGAATTPIETTEAPA